MAMTTQPLRSLLLALLAAAPVFADEPRRLPPIEGSHAPADGDLTFDPQVTLASTEQPLFGVAYQGECAPWEPRFEVGAQFDKGIFVRGRDLKKDPFALYVGGRLQVRHTGFAPSEEEWTDSAGVTRTIRSRNNLETERARINFSGTALDPAMTYYFILDGDSDGASNVDMLAYIFTYKADDRLKFRFGRWKVASDREWLMTSRFLTLVDRSMATEYFRAGFSDGVWLLGDLDCGLHYEMSLTNGLRSSNRRTVDLDENLAYAATAYFEPLGDFGKGFTDYAWHESPVVQIGGSFAYARSSDRSDAGFPTGDNNFVRLSDGTLLASNGALAPGVQLLSDELLEGAIDFALKWRGLSVTSEFFVRSIQNLKADGPIAVSQINDYGYRCDIGYFFIPQRLDGFARISSVNGAFGDAYEYAVGVNYYWGSQTKNGKLDDRVNKLSFDVTRLIGTPTTSGPSDLIAGDTGVLFRTQIQIGF